MACPWRLQQHWRPSFLVSVNQLLSENSTEVYWFLVLCKCSLAHARPWCLYLVVCPCTLAGRPAHRPCWAAFTSLKCAWSWVAFIIHFHRALFTMKQSSACDVAKGRPFLCPSVTLPEVSLYLCYNLLMTLCDTLSSVATSLWEHPIWSLAMARYCWSIVRCRLGLIMSTS